MENQEFLKEICGTYGYTRFDGMNFIANRARIAVELAGLSMMGMTKKRGIVVMYARNTGTGSAIVKCQDFSFETVLDSPSVLINWKRELDNCSAY